MGQCSQCIKRDCGFPSQTYQGKTPEEYEQYLKNVFFLQLSPFKSPLTPLSLNFPLYYPKTPSFSRKSSKGTFPNQTTLL